MGSSGAHPERRGARGLLPYEARGLAFAACAITVAYSAFVALFGVGIVVDCTARPKNCDGASWLPPALAAATVVALLATTRAAAALWRTARSGEDPGRAIRRFGIAWLAALVWGLLLFWPGAMQLLYTAMALPALVVLLAMSRAAAAIRRRGRRSSRQGQET